MSKRGIEALPPETLKMLELGMRLLPVKARDKHPLITE